MLRTTVKDCIISQYISRLAKPISKSGAKFIVLIGVLSSTALVAFLAFRSFASPNATITVNHLANAALAQGTTQEQNAETAKEEYRLPVAGTTNFVAKILKLYQIREGDTLSAIAANFDISIDTIRNANNLRSDNLKVGDKLLILQDNGLLVKTDRNTTLPDIAKKFKTNVEQLVVDNGLISAEDVPELVYCYRCQLPQNKVRAAIVRIESPNSNEEIMALEPEGNMAGSHEFPKGYCTYYVAKKMLIKFGGNARNWLLNAREIGYKTGGAPIAGAAVITTEHPVYWHVAFVEQVKGDSILVSEMNYKNLNEVSTREIPINSKTIKGYIYPL